MKIVMLSQEYCAPCRQLEPHLKAAAAQLGYEVEKIDIAQEWDTYSQLGVEYTPTVFVVEDDVYTRLQTTDPRVQKPNALAIKVELEQYV